MAVRDAGVGGPTPHGEGSRAARQRMPVAFHVVEAVAVSHGVCVQPVPVRRIDPETGESTIVDIPCGNTLESHCPPCAEVKRQVRMAQFGEWWHLDEEPVVEADDPDEVQLELATLRADLEAALVLSREEGRDEAPVLAAIEQVDEDLARAGVRGSTVPNRTRRRARSTRRRQDVPDLPRRKVDPRTVGRTYRPPDGKVFRPSIFLTLTCRSYGRVDAEDVPVDMERYDYRGQVRDSIHFATLVDRFFQNARRFVGYEIQYCATLEPQRLPAATSTRTSRRCSMPGACSRPGGPELVRRRLRWVWSRAGVLGHEERP
ncbi:MAG TPA: replication initiator [Nocardioides sp.]